MKRRLYPLLKLPLQVLSLASQDKSFEGNPVIGNYWLNRMGLHVLRVVLAHGVMRVRRCLVAWRLPAEQRRLFRRDGFLMLDNFLSQNEFQCLLETSESLMNSPEAVQTQQGDSATWQLFFGNERLNKAPALKSLLGSARFKSSLGYVAGRLRTPFHWLQVVRNGQMASSIPDPQRSLHSDTFQPSMKAWLFLTDADDRNGAFTYVPGSHRINRDRLAWEYRQSLIGARQPTPYAARGSFRIDPETLPSLGLPAPKALQCRANTLIIADTCGFHCRGEASQANARRVEIWSLSRTNPFNPMPGLPFESLNGIERFFYPRFEALRQRLRRSQQARKART